MERTQWLLLWNLCRHRNDDGLSGWRVVAALRDSVSSAARSATRNREGRKVGLVEKIDCGAF